MTRELIGLAIMLTIVLLAVVVSNKDRPFR